MTEERKIREQKHDIKWKHKRKRMLGTTFTILGVTLALGVGTAIGVNYFTGNIDLSGGSNSGGSGVNNYSYKNTKQFEIKFDSIFSQELYQYLVFFYADDCPHCHEKTLERKISTYAFEGPVKVYFVHTKQYSNPTEIMANYNLAQDENEAKACVGASSLTEFKFFGFPSMYFIKGEGENTAENINSKKHIEGVYIGNDEIKGILDANK